jgi:transcriptional regulator with XRE-family HTH domain
VPILPPNAVRADERPGLAWFSCGARALDAWKKRLGLSVRDVAARVGCAHGTISNWTRGERTPLDGQRKVLEEVTGGEVPASWWFFWALGDGLEDDRPSPAPESGPREIALPELGSTPDELRASVRRALALLGEKEITLKQRLDAEGRIQVGLSALARLEERAKLEEHPDFAAFRADILGSIEDAFGDLCTPERLRALSESMRRRGQARKAAA